MACNVRTWMLTFLPQHHAGPMKRRRRMLAFIGSSICYAQSSVVTGLRTWRLRVIFRTCMLTWINNPWYKERNVHENLPRVLALEKSDRLSENWENRRFGRPSHRWPLTRPSAPRGRSLRRSSRTAQCLNFTATWPEFATLPIQWGATGGAGSSTSKMLTDQ